MSGSGTIGPDMQLWGVRNRGGRYKDDDLFNTKTMSVCCRAEGQYSQRQTATIGQQSTELLDGIVISIRTFSCCPVERHLCITNIAGHQ